MERVIHKNWKLINDSLPLEETQTGKLNRIALFKLIDSNNNGTLSLNEIQTGIRHNLKLDELTNCKTAIFKAFEAVRFSRRSKTSKLKKSDHFIVFSEFKRFLVYLRQYFEYFEMFDRLDSDSNKKIDVYEFAAALPTIEKWGVKVEDAEKVFNEIDDNRSGFIIFDEFCHWAIQNSLDIEDDDDFDHKELKGMK